MHTVINMKDVSYYVYWDKFERKYNDLELIYKPGDVIETIKWFRRHKKICNDYIYRNLDNILNDCIYTWNELIKMGCKNIEHDSNGVVYYKPGITYYLKSGKKINYWYDNEIDLKNMINYLNLMYSDYMVKIY